MSEFSRRAFVASVGAVSGVGLLGGSCAAEPAARRYVTSSGAPDWPAVRGAYRLDPNLKNLGLFYLASNPKPVREAIDRYSALIDANPLSINSPPPGTSAESALAGFIGGVSGEIALVQNTTIGLGLVYNGLVVKPGQEFLITEHDHFVHNGAAQLAADKRGATVRQIRLFANSATATVDEVASKLRAAITAKTRVVGTTWVQSSSGVRMPVEAMAAVIAAANQGRTEADRCLLVVDGVHGLAAVDADAARLGADFFVAGTHKWLGGPRGTGLMWVKSTARQHLRPMASTFTSNPLTPGGFVAYEHRWAVPAAVAFQQEIGRTAAAARITELSTRLKDGLAGIPGVTLQTPRSASMSAGITCFEKSGVSNGAIVESLRAKGILITTASHRIGYARIGTGLPNTPEEVDAALAAIRAV
ncbi:aminotransferase class V-fold PLP-dependent enzyme [Actinokineospora sp.]|uniref:aminotransferase class V-fold PLP-dependent enzyme n=1 Tax=Actinokineospora sp. TaxID=1872133 RepID=UPI003D6C6771